MEPPACRGLSRQGDEVEFQRDLSHAVLMHNPLSHDALQSYLFFGADYTGMRERGATLFADCDTAKYRQWARSASQDKLVKEGVHRLRQATRDALEQAGPGLQALQLSGGYDSRAILGCLLEYVSPSEIVALTFGTPGAPDFEIPRLLAKDVGVRHIQLDATEVEYDLESVVGYASTALSRLPAALVLERYINYLLRMRVGTTPTFWVGFLGDSLAGAHLPSKPSLDWDSGIDFFIRTNRRAKSVALAKPGWDPRALLPREPLVDPANVGIDDQLDIAGRQAHLIEIPWSSFRDQYVFDQSVWKSFMLAMPWEQRANGTPLYKRILAEAFPKLSTFPVQGNRERPVSPGAVTRALQRIVRKGRRIAERVRPSPKRLVSDVMRFDYASDLRGGSSHAVHVRALTRALDIRGVVPHLDIDRLWSEHLGNSANHAPALMILAGLEANLQAMERVSDVYRDREVTR